MFMVEKIYTIPLRSKTQKKPFWYRSTAGIKAIRAFIKRHMKNENVKISKELNEALWAKSRGKPPAKVKVKAKEEKGVVSVSLFEEDVKKEIKEGGSA